MLEMEKLVGKLPAGVGHDWTGASYEERVRRFLRNTSDQKI
jgi:hypothetical protein